MPIKWKIKKDTFWNDCDAPHRHPVIAKILANRGIKDKVAAQKFLEPKYEGLNSPFLFRDMEKAVQRIWKALENGEKIVIYGDYDADAVTANAVLRQTFRYLGTEVESYIPDRFSEGYGVSLEALTKIKESGAELIITVDCGTNSASAAKFCKENGIVFIITDHHEIIGEVPDAFALINPKNLKDNYPFSELTGVGVAFKLAQGLLSNSDRVGARLARPRSSEDGRLRPALTKHVEGWEKWLLDLVAIGIVADCHSLLGENRILVKYGLKVFAKTKWTGLKALIETSKINFNQRPLDTYALGFIIAPRLNAAGRLEHANLALDLLLCEDYQEALKQARHLEEVNSRRQNLTLQVVSEAREKALIDPSRKILALWAPDWPKGVVGLAAGRLCEEFKKPVIVLEKGDRESTGSARSAGNFNIVESLKYASEYLVRFGGHSQAAGLTLLTSDFDSFYQKILEYAENQIMEDEPQSELEFEAEIFPNDLNLEFYKLLSDFEPFGVGNPKPKFFVSNCLVDSLKCVGAQNQHTQIRLSLDGKIFDAIWFNAGNFAKNLKIGDTVDVACEIDKDCWNGNEKLKLKIIDMRKDK
jgi:single-stranded-DNA-specific exonuclease